MSVIITGMDMPYGCAECGGCYDYREDKYFCALHNESFDIDIDKDKPKRCPLKSIDGLIKKIVNSPSDVGQDMYKTKYDGAARRQNEIIEIIKEYCEVSE